LRDVRVWNQKDLAVLIELDALIDDPEQLPPEAPLPLDCRSCSHFDLSAGESFEVGEPHQRPLEPWRAHFEAVRPGRKQVGMDVQCRRYVPTDRCAILQGYPATHLHAGDLTVDDDPDDGPGGFPQIAQVDQIHPVGVANGVDQLFQRVDELFRGVGQFLLGVPKRKMGGPWRPTQERVNQIFSQPRTTAPHPLQANWGFGAMRR